MSEERIVTLTLGYDQDCEDPRDFDGAWKIYTGGELRYRMTDRGDAYDYKWLPDSLDLFWKLRNGLAFTLGGWVDAGSSGTNLWINTPYDPTDKIVGLMIFEEPAENMGAKTYDERTEDAKSFLDEFNKWAQGECFWFSTSGYQTDWRDNQSHWSGDGDSCGGFIGYDYFKECVRESFEYAEYKIDVVVPADEESEALFSHRMLPDGIEYRTRAEQRQIEEEYEEIAREEAGEMCDYDTIEREVA